MLYSSPERARLEPGELALRVGDWLERSGLPKWAWMSSRDEGKVSPEINRSSEGYADAPSRRLSARIPRLRPQATGTCS